MLAYMKAKEEEKENVEEEKEEKTQLATPPGNETRPEDTFAKEDAVNGTTQTGFAAEASGDETRGDEAGGDEPGVGVAEVPGAVGASAAARGGGGDAVGATVGSELGQDTAGEVSESDGKGLSSALGGTRLAAGVAAFGCVGLVAAVWAARRATSGPHSSLERGWSSVKLPSGFRAKDNNAGGGEKDVRYRELQMTEEAATEGVGGSSSSSSSNEGRRGGRKKGGRRMTTEEESFYDL